MAMSIRTHVASLDSQRNLFQTQLTVASSLSKLSSGDRITKAGDDGAGLGIGVSLEAQIRSYNQASRNALHAVSVVRSAEGSLARSSSILSRLRELAVRSASDGIGDTERTYLQRETAALVAELDRAAHATELNGQALLDSASTTLTFQVGIPDTASDDRITVGAADVTAGALGQSVLSLASATSARTALKTIDAAVERVYATRARFGAIGDGLDTAIGTLKTAAENLAAANSRVRDVDGSEESPLLMRNQILLQVGVSVMSQANQQPQVALKLLQ